MNVESHIAALQRRRVAAAEFWAIHHTWENLRAAIAREYLWIRHEGPLAEARWADDGGRA